LLNAPKEGCLDFGFSQYLGGEKTLDLELTNNLSTKVSIF